MDAPTLARFMAKVDQSGDCWLWTAQRNDRGYGQFWLERRQRRAHTVAYEHFHGPIPDGLVVCHNCDTPPCVNPAHLRADTIGGNTREAYEKGRLRVAERGAAHHNAALDEAAVLAIRADERPLRAIAADYGVARSTIQDIKHRRRWGWLD